MFATLLALAMLFAVMALCVAVPASLIGGAVYLVARAVSRRRPARNRNRN